MIPTTHGINPGLSNKFYIKEPNTKTKIWSHWFNTRIRQYMILEIFLIISLFMIFYRLQTISNQNERVLEMVNSMERKLEALASQKPNQDIRQFDNIKPLEQSAEPRKIEIPSQDSTEKMKPPILEMKHSTSKTDNNTFEASISERTFRFNAADYLLGASVDFFLSSRSNLEQNLRFEEANLVLLDRPQPPADKAWCTSAENPSLTIDLAQYTKPISVSYQHSKWNATIPKEAPKTYDVVACFDCQCKVWEPLATNCQYSQHQSNGTEQICNVSYDKNFPLIGKVQFRFRENYGDPNMTCVNLVRVYGESKTPIKIEKPWNSEKTCADLKWYYHNSYIKYSWADKNCRVLYENECCSECPECCQECSINDHHNRLPEKIRDQIKLLIIISVFMCLVHCYRSLREKRNRVNLLKTL